MHIGLHVKYTLFLSNFNGTWICTKHFRKKSTQIPKLIKICPVGTKLLHTDGQTWRS
jgi:hypothetical protein